MSTNDVLARVFHWAALVGQFLLSMSLAALGWPAKRLWFGGKFKFKIFSYAFKS